MPLPRCRWHPDFCRRLTVCHAECERRVDVGPASKCRCRDADFIPMTTGIGPTAARLLGQVPCRPTDCSLGQIEGLHELIEGPCSPTEFSLRPAQDMVRLTKNLLGVLQGLLKSNSGLQFTQAYKGNSQANSGLLSLTRAPPSSTGHLLADKMPSLIKRDPFRPKEGPLRVAQGTFRPK